MCALALPVPWIRNHNEEEESVFSQLVALDFGCRMSEASNVAIEKTGRAWRHLLAKRRDIASRAQWSPVMAVVDSPLEGTDTRTGWPVFADKRHSNAGCTNISAMVTAA